MDRFECHLHSGFSNLRLLDCINKPEQIVERAKELGLAGFCITDHESVAGYIKFNKLAAEVQKEIPSFKIGLGNEIYLVDERPNNDHYHFILIAKDAEGCKQLRYLSSIAWMNSYTAKGLERVDTLKSDLEAEVTKNPGHLIASTACLGSELDKETLALIKAEKAGNETEADNHRDKIINFMLWCTDLFGEDFYIECQPGCSKQQIMVNMRLLSIAKAFHVKMIVTTDAHYLSKDKRQIHKAFLTSSEGEREVDAFYEYAYLQTNEEIYENLAQSNYDKLFIDQLFANTMDIYSKIENYSLLHSQQIPDVEVKDYPKSEQVIDGYPTLTSMLRSDDKVERYWVNQCLDAMKERGIDSKEYYDELEEEAEVKKIVGERLSTNMFRYPVLLQHYIDLIWECGSTIGAGRGSACSALNHYLLNITQLDPLEWKFPFFRYMNRDTDGLGDIDIDVCPSKRPLILSKIKEERGANIDKKLDELSRKNLGCTMIATFGTATAKAAVSIACRGYRSEEYPDGIDTDIAKYLSSLIPSERGFVWSLHDTYYGNPDKERRPVATFRHEVDAYPGLFEIMEGVQGVITQRGIHASGVIMFDEDPYVWGSFMKTTSGEIITQYDLHDAEAAGGTKLDILVTTVQDIITETLTLLQEQGYVEQNLNLRELYNKYLHPSVLPLDDKATWKVIQNASSLGLFQLDSVVGRQGAKKVRPSTMNELSAVNGLIRLMAEPGEESPMDKYVRFRDNPHVLLQEQRSYGLTGKEIIALNRYVGETYGIGISQEQLMKTLMDEDICNFSLKEANKARKTVSKKKMTEIPVLKEKVFNSAKSEAIANYVWDYIVSPSLGYGFSDIHSISYSFIGFQTAYLTTRWKSIFWNTAYLIVNSGALEADSDDQTDYAKIAKALGEIKSSGIKVSLVDINRSDFSFKPDAEHNEILFGMKALNKINSDIVSQIIAGRPYTGIKDFMARCPINRPAMISLIKAGAFDKVDEEWASQMGNVRKTIMSYYIMMTCDLKKRLTLQNYNGLITNNILPASLDHYKTVYEFNKYLKKYCVSGDYYTLDDENAYSFYCNHYDVDALTLVNKVASINAKKWKKMYDTDMTNVSSWLKEHQEEALQTLNNKIFMADWEKYAAGSISAWEMDSMTFYHSPHELADVNIYKYGLSDFRELPSTPVIEYMYRNSIPIYELTRIIGTVLAKNDTRASISLLTTTGVVNVKFTKDQYAYYNKQISAIGDDDKKHVLEKGWFSRGSKLMLTGYRREDTFVVKTYKNTSTHQVYRIINVNKGDMTLEHERADEKN